MDNSKSDQTNYPQDIEAVANPLPQAYTKVEEEKKAGVDILNQLRELSRTYKKINQLDSLHLCIESNRIISRTGGAELRALAESADEYKDIHKDIDLMKMGQFDWSDSRGAHSRIFNLLYMRDEGLKGALTVGDNLKSLLFIYLNPAFIRNIVTPEVVYQYLENDYKDYVSEKYHLILGLQCRFLESFYIHHLLRDYRYERIIDVDCCKIIDPLTRISIREAGMKEGVLKDKYFNPSFNLKSFVFVLLDKYFPSLNSRYIGWDHSIHLLTFQIIRLMFDNGLWNLEEAVKLSRIILEKTEALTKLWDVIEFDSREDLRHRTGFTDKIVESYKSLKISIMINIAQILIHIILLVNDESLKESIDWPRIENLNDTNLWKNAFFRGEELNLIITSTLVGYVLKGGLENALIELSSTTEKLHPLMKYQEIILQILSEKEVDIFINSNELVDESTFKYYTEEIKKDHTDQVKDLSNHIDLLIDDIAHMRGTTLKEGQLSDFFDSKVKLLCKEFNNLLEKGAVSQEVNFLIQMKLVEHNIIWRIVCLMKISFPFILEESRFRLGYVLTLICSDNSSAQAQLFIGESKGIIQYLQQSHSSLFMFMNYKIFYGKKKQLFYLNTELFTMTIEIFKDLVSRVEKTGFLLDKVIEDKQSSVRLLIATYFCNLYISDLILPSSSKSMLSKRNYDLVVQELILDLLEKVLTNFILINDFASLEGASPILDNKTSEEISKLIDSADKLDDKSINILMLEVAKSFLFMFNCASQRVFFSASYSIIKEQLKIENLKKMKVFMKFGVGIEVKTEISKLFMNYCVFSSDGLLTNRSKHLFNKRGQEALIHSSDIDNELILANEIQELVNLKNITTSPIIRSYLLDGLLPSLYKYICGIKSVYYVSTLDTDNKEDKNSIEVIGAIVRSLGTILFEQIPIIYEKLGGINTKKPGNKLAELSDIDTKKILKYPDAESDEMIYPGLYSLRKSADIILEVIKGCYKSLDPPQISRFMRPSPLRRDIEAGSKIFRKLSLQIDSIDRNYLTFKEGEISTMLTSESWQNKYKLYKKVQLRYIVEKEVVGVHHIIVNYLSSNSDKLVLLITYTFIMLSNIIKRPAMLIRSIQGGISTKKLASDSIIAAYFQYSHIQGILRFFVQLINYDIPGLREIVYFMLGAEETSHSLFFDKGKELCKALNVIGGHSPFKIISDNEVSSLFYLMQELGQFCNNKVFHDENIDDVWSHVMTISEFFKSLCENRSIYFKRLFSNFKPRLLSLPEYNAKTEKKDSESLFSMYSQWTLAFCKTSLDWINRQPELSMSDKPEIIQFKVRWIELLIEFVNGPCPYNQRLIYNQSTDYFIGVALRVIDDVSQDSQIYSIKKIVVDYILAVMEGEGVEEIDEETSRLNDEKFLVTDYLASNINPSVFLNVIYQMLKRLYIHRKMTIDPKYTKLIKSKLVGHNATHKSNSIGSKNSVKSVQERRNEYIFSDNTDSKCTVTEEICSLAPQITLKDLFDLYVNDDGFSNHSLIETSFKMYTVISQISERSSRFKLFLDSKKQAVAQAFGGEIIGETPSSLQLSGITSSKADINKLSEEHHFVAFFIKITRKLEIAIEYSDSKNRVNKIVHFRREPQTYFINNESMKSIFSDLDLINMRVDFQLRFPLYFAEMEGGHSLQRTSNLLYKVLGKRSLQILKYAIWIFGLCINIILLFSASLSDNAELQDRYLEQSDFWKLLVFYLSIALGTCSILIWLIWVLFYLRYQINLELEHHRLTNPIDVSWRLTKLIKLVIWRALILKGGSFNFFMHTVFAVLAISTNEIFHAFHLILLINFFPVGHFLIRAIFGHIDQLLLTTMLAVFVIYSYSMITANYYSDRFDTMDVGELDVCNTLWSCFLYVLNLGLRNGGGVSDSHEIFPLDVPTEKIAAKIIFNLSFFVFINVIALNIIFGIIIDSFSEIRTEDAEREDSVSNECLICSLERTDFEEMSKKFSEHVNFEHNPYNYVFYLYSITKRMLTSSIYDLNADELCCYIGYKEGNPDWIPYKATGFLTNGKEEEEKDILKLVRDLKLRVGKNDARINQVHQLTKVSEYVSYSLLEKIIAVLDKLNPEQGNKAKFNEI